MATGPGEFNEAFNLNTFSATLPLGHYFARVRATNDCGTSNQWTEMEFTITP